MLTLTKVGSFVGILEATDFASVSKEEKWSEGLFPVRVPATPIVAVKIPNFIPIKELLGELSFSRDGKLRVCMRGAACAFFTKKNGIQKMAF